MSMVEAVLEKRRLECSFLVERCEQDWLTTEQKTTIKRRIDFLKSESQILSWLTGMPQLDPPDCASLNSCDRRDRTAA
jgi:hypothetical protein